jgi:hypothetical protein
MYLLSRAPPPLPFLLSRAGTSPSSSMAATFGRRRGHRWGRGTPWLRHLPATMGAPPSPPSYRADPTSLPAERPSAEVVGDSVRMPAWQIAPIRGAAWTSAPIRGPAWPRAAAPCRRRGPASPSSSAGRSDLLPPLRAAFSTHSSPPSAPTSRRRWEPAARPRADGWWEWEKRREREREREREEDPDTGRFTQVCIAERGDAFLHSGSSATQNGCPVCVFC